MKLQVSSLVSIWSQLKILQSYCINLEFKSKSSDGVNAGVRRALQMYK